MKRILTFALFALVAASVVVAPAQMTWAQTGVQTYAARGIFNGRAYSSITLNYDTRAMTFNFNDGGQFTTYVEQDIFNEMARRLQSAKPPPS